MSDLPQGRGWTLPGALLKKKKKKMLCGCVHGVQDLKRDGLDYQFPYKESWYQVYQPIRNVSEMQSPGPLTVLDLWESAPAIYFVPVLSSSHKAVLKHDEVWTSVVILQPLPNFWVALCLGKCPQCISFLLSFLLSLPLLPPLKTTRQPCRGTEPLLHIDLSYPPRILLALQWFGINCVNSLNWPLQVKP